MGGKDGSRGYVYQGIAAVLESLTQTGWDRIYIEFPSKYDKVDIALAQGDNVVQAIQVKSSKNPFSQKDLRQWIQEISNDYFCPQYKIVLIGQCSGTALDFVNSISKFQNQEIDKKVERSLSNFDTSILERASVKIQLLPNDLDFLQVTARDSLSKYLANELPPLAHPQIDFIVKAMLTDQLLQSTQGGYTERTSFDSDLRTRIDMLSKKYEQTRKLLHIQSFSRGVAALTKDTMSVLNLLDYFNGKSLKQGSTWNGDILPSVETFFSLSTDQKSAYKILLDTHSSIAFAAGRICDSKSGIDILPIQKTGAGGQQLWELDTFGAEAYPKLEIRHSRTSYDSTDTVLIISITHNIENDVYDFIESQNIPFGRTISCAWGDQDATSFSVKNGTHAYILAHSIYAALAGRTTVERKATLHIFASAPNAFMFFLGKLSHGFGKCKLYEYDFELKGSGSYTTSICYI